MSRSQDSYLSRSCFLFRNPFKMISPKGSHMSPQLHAMLQAFEATLTKRLEKLTPKSKDEILTVAWMTLAMKSLCETHNDIATLITNLEHSYSDWEEKWVDVYFDISAKLLDICNAFKSELSHMIRANILLQYALHTLDSASSKEYLRAYSLFDDWRKCADSRSPKIEKLSSMLDFMESLNLPTVKNSIKGKVFMQAMYGVKLQIIVVCRVFIAAFTGASIKLKDLNVDDIYSWAPAFRSLQNLVNEEIRVRFSDGKSTILNKLEAIDTFVKTLHPPTFEGDVDAIEKESIMKTESLVKIVKELHATTEKFSQEIDLLGDEMDELFHSIITCQRPVLAPVMKFNKAIYKILTM